MADQANLHAKRGTYVCRATRATLERERGWIWHKSCQGQGWHEKVLMWLNASPAWQQSSTSKGKRFRFALRFIEFAVMQHQETQWFWGANTKTASVPHSTPSTPLCIQVCMFSEQETIDYAPLFGLQRAIFLQRNSPEHVLQACYFGTFHSGYYLTLKKMLLLCFLSEISLKETP